FPKPVCPGLRPQRDTCQEQECKARTLDKDEGDGGHRVPLQEGVARAYLSRKGYPQTQVSVSLSAMAKLLSQDTCRRLRHFSRHTRSSTTSGTFGNEDRPWRGQTGFLHP